MDQTMNRLIAVILPTLVLLAGPALARKEPESSPESTRAYREGYNLVLNGDWQAARAAFEALIREHPQSGWVDDAAFWRCYAGGQLRQSAEEVFGCYEDLVERYPRSEWEDDAKRAMVRLAARLDQEGKAQYRERVRDYGRGEDDRELMQVLVALGEIGDERSIDIILERLEATEDEHLRARIVDVLEDIDSPLVMRKLSELVTSDPSEQVRLAAVDAIADRASVDSQTLLRQIALDRNQPPRVRVEALDELSDNQSPDLVSLLSELATDAELLVADEALDELADIGNRAALDAMISLLGVIPDVERRMDILDEIADYDSEPAVQALLDVARNDPDPRIRRAATEALGEMETTAAREALIQLLQGMGEEE